MKIPPPDFTYELTYLQKDYAVIGLDEVGRGCLAGPVTVGGVCFTQVPDDIKKWLTMGIHDSKKLTALKRENLATLLKEKCLYETASTSVDQINKKGIVQSIFQSMAEIVQSFKKRLPDKKIILLIDGAPISHIPYINDLERVSIVKGDCTCISIAAASILAKVERDEHMNVLDNEYPAYFWKENKGYGTAKHRHAIQNVGISPYHRTLFIRNILGIR